MLADIPLPDEILYGKSYMALMDRIQ
ncbi:hypothetical protein SPIROBIBN47_90053 [uncultured spirochete]|uniref:Uncharacterized protein n=1 Tax=uncultured spirochete TaxID=156406 RepID=A0A3P3XMU0_9SPIR|nr:hypothetical protein SPIROBIBN47_90053 [uncultured spirochete]